MAAFDLSPPALAQIRAIARLVTTRANEVALVSDFDGTLAPIVVDPADARPHPPTLAAFEALAQVVGTAAIVSGRPLSFLEPLVEDSIDLYGLYGLEWRVDGVRGAIDGASSWAPVIDEMARLARVELPATVGVESKGLSLTLHHRTVPEVGPAVMTWAREAKRRWGVQARSAKASVELHPAIAVDKGTVVAAVSAGHRGVVYFGDDVGDLPAFAALGRLQDSGVIVLRIGVDSPEVPERLAVEADAMVPGVAGVGEVLRLLMGSAIA